MFFFVAVQDKMKRAHASASQEQCCDSAGHRRPTTARLNTTATYIAQIWLYRALAMVINAAIVCDEVVGFSILVTKVKVLKRFVRVHKICVAW